MRDIKYIVIHCTATPQTSTIASIQRYWRDVLGWKSPGYHFIIKPDGEIVPLLDISKPSNGVAGYNAHAIHISYVGGVDAKNKALDNRTDAQKESLVKLVKHFKLLYPKALVQGHRDFPGVRKDCPSFDAKTEYST